MTQHKVVLIGGEGGKINYELRMINYELVGDPALKVRVKWRRHALHAFYSMGAAAESAIAELGGWDAQGFVTVEVCQGNDNQWPNWCFCYYCG